MAPRTTMVAWTEYTDDMAKQGALVFRFYTHGAADHAHDLGCPGCDPKASDNPALDEWFRIEAKWAALGDPPSCPRKVEGWQKERAARRAEVPA